TAALRTARSFRQRRIASRSAGSRPSRWSLGQRAEEKPAGCVKRSRCEAAPTKQMGLFPHPCLAVVFRVILGDVAQDLAGAREIAVAPAVVGRDEEDVVAKARRRVDGERDAASGVALAAPDG